MIISCFPSVNDLFLWTFSREHTSHRFSPHPQPQLSLIRHAGAAAKLVLPSAEGRTQPGIADSLIKLLLGALQCAQQSSVHSEGWVHILGHPRAPALGRGLYVFREHRATGSCKCWSGALVMEGRKVDLCTSPHHGKMYFGS